MNLNEFIKISRKEKKLTLIQLSKKADLSYSMLYRIEDGSLTNPHPDIIKKISYALQLNYQDLLYLAGYLHQSPHEMNQAPIEPLPIVNWETFRLLDSYSPPFPQVLPEKTLHKESEEATLGILMPSEHWSPFFKLNDILIFSNNRPLAPNQWVIVKSEKELDIRMVESFKNDYYARSIISNTPSIHQSILITDNHIGTIIGVHYAHK